MIFKPKRLIIKTKKGCTLSKKTKGTTKGGYNLQPLENQ